jgi:hypothetical protein
LRLDLVHEVFHVLAVKHFLLKELLMNLLKDQLTFHFLLVH